MALVNLDFNIEEVKTGFDPLPTDKYPARLIEQELTKSSNGNNMVKVKWEITEGEYTGRFVWDNVVLIESCAWKVKQYMELIGVTTGSKLDPSLFQGVEAVLDIKTRPKNEKERKDAEAKGYDPDELNTDIKNVTLIG